MIGLCPTARRVLEETPNMYDGCSTCETTKNRNDQSAPVEDEPARVRELEARLAELEARVEMLERIIRRQLW